MSERRGIASMGYLNRLQAENARLRYVKMWADKSLEVLRDLHALLIEAGYEREHTSLVNVRKAISNYEAIR